MNSTFRKLFNLFRVMKIVILFMLIGLTHLSAEVRSQNASVSLKLKDATVEQVILEVEKQLKQDFFFSKKEVDVTKKISVNLNQATLDELVQVIFGEGFGYRLVDNLIVITPKTVVAKEEEKTVLMKGQVVDKGGDPLPGVTVLIEGTTVGCATDVDGKFSLPLPKELKGVVVFRFVGMETQKVKLADIKDREILAGKKDLKVVMEEQTEKMDEVVVTGIFTRKKEGFTGSATQVSGEELKRMTSGNVLKALQMLDPGFKMNTSNLTGSNPNAIPDFQMRGQASMGNYQSDDVVVLRGDVNTRPNQPLFVLDGVIGVDATTIMDLDPEQVESITLLKDAAATVIYGSEAANGVVVVETKAPAPGKLRFTYNGNYELQWPDLSVYDLMDAEEKLEYERMAGVFSTTSQLNYYNKYKEEILRGVDTYWLSEPLRTAVTHRHTLTMEGGDEALRYNLGINYSREPGVMKESGRNSMGLNLSLQYRQKKWNIQNQLSLTNVRGDNSPYGSFSQYTKLNPYYRKTDENGRYTSLLDQKKLPGEGGGTVNIVNPLYNLLWKYKDFTENFSVVDNFNIECAILDNLRVSAGASITKGTSRMEVFKSMNHTDFLAEQDLTRKGSYNKSTGDNVSWSVNASVNYNYTKDKHLLSLFGRWNVDESKSNSVNLSAMGFPNDNMDDFLFAYEMEDRVSGTESTSRTVGIIGQVSYMYDMRFSVDFSIRGDLSSQFGANTGMAPFWAAGARWNLHREKWLQNTIISNLVLRGSYGVTGSQSYSPYQAKETYSYDDLLFPYPSSDILGAQLKGMGNPDLGWSTTENRSLAVEIGLWNSRVNASFSYYNNYTDELLLDYNMAPSTGFATKTMNVGAVENEGYDISLSVMPIQDYERQIQWSVSMNGSHNRNVIKKISNEMKAMNQKNLEKKNGSPEAIYEEGKSTPQLFVVPSLGIDPATGQEVFLNRNGEKTYIWDPLDKVAIGDTEPKLRGAVSSAFTYKNWSVSLACSYEFGGWWYNQTLVDKIENSSAAYNLDRRALSHRWSENNRDARYKAIKMTNQDTGMSSRFAQKRNEFSFTSLAVGYRFDPKNFKFLQACRIASVSLNATMEELGRISSIRTERGLDYPFARTFSVSLSVLFN